MFGSSVYMRIGQTNPNHLYKNWILVLQGVTSYALGFTNEVSTDKHTLIFSRPFGTFL